MSRNIINGEMIVFIMVVAMLRNMVNLMVMCVGALLAVVGVEARIVVRVRFLPLLLLRSWVAIFRRGALLPRLNIRGLE